MIKPRMAVLITIEIGSIDDDMTITIAFDYNINVIIELFAIAFPLKISPGGDASTITHISSPSWPRPRRRRDGRGYIMLCILIYLYLSGPPGWKTVGHNGRKNILISHSGRCCAKRQSRRRPEKPAERVPYT